MRRSTVSAIAAGLVLLAGSPSFSQGDPRSPTTGSDQREVPARARVQKLSEIVGSGVENLKGEDLGKIDDLVVTQEDGCVAYALVSFGGILGIGDKLVTVAWNRLKPGAKKKTFILDVSEEDLGKAPAVDKDNLPATILSRAPLDPARPSGSSSSPTAPRQEQRSPSRDTEESARDGSLAFKLKKGHRFTFEASVQGLETSVRETETDARETKTGKRETGTVDAPEDQARGDEPSERRQQHSYSMIVQDVSERGEITLHLALDGAKAWDAGLAGAAAAAGQDREIEESTASSGLPSLNIMTLTLGPDGRLKRTGAVSRIPPELEPHFQFIFGSGLHAEALQGGKLYTLAPLYEGASPGDATSGDSRATQLRYEGTALHGDHEMARFSILGHYAGSATPASVTAPADGEEPRKKEVPPAEAPSAAGAPEWKAMGEAVYRTADGLLEKVTFGPASSRSSPEGDGSVESMTIVRVRTVP